MKINPAHNCDRILITGSRNFNDYDVFEKHLLGLDILKKRCMLISGGQRGIDSLVKPFCIKHRHFYVELPVLNWEWDDFGKSAGSMRNERMYIFGDPTYVVAFPGPESRGTYQALNIGKKLDIPHSVFEVSE